jgi:hypothetical protein
MTTCPNSIPIENLILFTNDLGEFSSELAFIAQDDLLEISVEAEGYDVYHREFITYTAFSEQVEIILSPNS